MLTILGSGELGADEEPSTFRENYIGDVGAVAVCSYPSKQGPDLPIDRRFNVDGFWTGSPSTVLTRPVKLIFSPTSASAGSALIEVVVGIGTVYTSLPISAFDDLTASLVRFRRVKLMF